MSLRSSIILVLSLSIFIVAASSGNRKNDKDSLMNAARKNGINRSQTGVKRIGKINNKRKNVRKSNKKPLWAKDSLMNAPRKNGIKRSQTGVKRIGGIYNKRKNIRNSNKKPLWAKENANTSGTTPATSQEKGQSCRCGLANLDVRVIGGDKVDPPRKYPWLVLVKMKNRGKQGQCSGSLISSGHVLTAGHCVYTGKNYLPSKNIKVQIGDHNVKKKDDNLKEETSILKVDIIKHPKLKLNDKKLDYDIVLLKLEKQLDLDEFQHVRPICLPENAKSTYFSIDAICAGWGLTKPFADKTPNTPYEITLKTTTRNCRGYRRKNTRYAVTKTQICTDVVWEKKTPFFGDSGGPLMVEEDGRYIEIGIVSGGRTRSGKTGGKGIAVYTSVAKLLKWILNKIKNDNRCI